VININCPQCGRPYEFDDARLGALEKCVQCGATFTIQRQPEGPQSAAGQQGGYAPPPPGFYPYPPPGYYPAYYPPPQPTNGNAVAALVLGIASLVVLFLGFILGPLGIYFGAKALREIGNVPSNSRGLATAGRVCGIIGTILSALIVLFYVVMIVVFVGLASHHPPHMQYPAD